MSKIYKISLDSFDRKEIYKIRNSVIHLQRALPVELVDTYGIDWLLDEIEEVIDKVENE